MVHPIAQATKVQGCARSAPDTIPRTAYPRDKLRFSESVIVRRNTRGLARATNRNLREPRARSREFCGVQPIGCQGNKRSLRRLFEPAANHLGPGRSERPLARGQCLALRLEKIELGEGAAASGRPQSSCASGANPVSFDGRVSRTGPRWKRSIGIPMPIPSASSGEMVTESDNSPSPAIRA